MADSLDLMRARRVAMLESVVCDQNKTLAQLLAENEKLRAEVERLKMEKENLRSGKPYGHHGGVE